MRCWISQKDHWHSAPYPHLANQLGCGVNQEFNMAEFVETIIVGGGQAGLSVSYYLSQQGRDHVVLEQSNQPGNAWRNHRWDSFVLNTPNWQTRLPGAEYQGDDPDGFMS